MKLSSQSINEIWPVYVILQKKKIYQKILQKLGPDKWLQALLCFQRIKYNSYWKMIFLKQATYIRYVIAKLSKFVQISMLTSTESFLQRNLWKSKRAWN